MTNYILMEIHILFTDKNIYGGPYKMHMKWWKTECLQLNVLRNYCLISKKKFTKGVHYLNTEIFSSSCSSYTDRIYCCIGVISKRKYEWVEHGIGGIWPSEGAEYSYFDAATTRPYWRSNETIRVKLDIDGGKVSFWKSDGKSKHLLIQESDIPRVNQWYFMITGLFGILEKINCNLESV